MKESENAGYIRNTAALTETELLDMIRLSEIVGYDGLRYERLLDAEEETSEL